MTNRPHIDWYLETFHDVIVPNGQRVSIRCPFHEDRSPSALVDRVGERLTCYTGCFNGEAVDVLDIVMQTEGLDFLAAKERVAEWPGTEVDDAPPPQSREGRKKRQRRQKKRPYSFKLLEG